MKKPRKKTHNKPAPKTPTDLNLVPAIMSVPEASALLPMDRAHTYQLISAQYFPPGIVGKIDGRYKILKDPLLEFLKSGGKQQQPEAHGASVFAEIW